MTGAGALRNDKLRDALRRAASALRARGPEFALAGSYALWAYGGPEPVHDVDLVVAEPDVEQAATTLQDAGFAIDRTPEDWLFKACMDEVVVDVLHRLNGVPVDKAMIASGEELDVLAIRMQVLSPTQVITEKLCSLNEHHCDFAALLPAVRAVREAVDWDSVRADSGQNDFAVAFLVLTDRLGITA
jgi:predicted nucleotidyltransferase